MKLKAIIIIVVILAGGGGGYYFLSNHASGNKYYNAYNHEEYIVLDDGGTFYGHANNMDVTGTYEISGNSLTIRYHYPGLTTKHVEKDTISGNTITDNDGMKWVKD
ncbi:MAG: hypothetical protein M1309_01995 [Actinobacteria bacterium]|nr:hypothetical protein [Actinomycetota bacterium]